MVTLTLAAESEPFLRPLEFRTKVETHWLATYLAGEREAKALEHGASSLTSSCGFTTESNQLGSTVVTCALEPLCGAAVFTFVPLLLSLLPEYSRERAAFPAEM